MRKQLLLSAAVLAPSLLFASGPSPFKASKENPFRYTYKSAQTLKLENDSRRDHVNSLLDPAKSRMSVKTTEASAQLDKSSEFGYLEGPNGAIWYYTSDPVIENVPVPGGYEGLTEAIVKEYKYTIYDNNLKPVGTIRDKVDINEDALETKPAQVMLNTVVTKKFFNIDDKYEVIVSVAMNRDLSSNPYPSVNYYSYVYSIGGAKTDEGYDVKVKSIDGYLVDSVNSAQDRWSENYFLTFLTESANTELEDYDEFLDSCVLNLTTYSRASYSGDMQVFQERVVKHNNLPGDQMSCPFMLSFLNEGKACFAYTEYEKKFYLTQGSINPDTGEFSDPIQNTDNNLVVTIYKDNGGKPELIQTTKIPVVIDKSIEGALFTFYGIGNMLYKSDVDYGNYLADKSKACFIVNKQIYVSKKDDYVENYIVYDPDGEELLTLSEGCDSFVELTDVKGEEPQIIFVYLNDEEYKLDFTDLYSGSVEATLGQTINGRMISALIDRVPYDNSYRYAVSMLNADVDEEDNVIHTICWLDSDAKLIEEEKLNLGKDVQYANLYIDQATLNPYLFDTDAAHEYMALVKRNTSASHTELQEELLVVSANGSTLLRLTPDSDKGYLFGITPIDLETNPRLNVVYRSDDYKYLSEFYNLPLSKFASGGDGTAENPYQIATAGDLRQIASGLNTHYKLVNDIDASNLEFAAINGQFTGSIDGDGHTISNLSVTPTGLSSGFFGRLDNGASIKNLNIVNASIELNSYIDRAGVLAGEASGATIDNVHVYNLTAKNSSDFSGSFGCLVGNAMLYTNISNCSVGNTSLDLPDASVGGIVGGMRTGVSIKACSFTGSLSGNEEVGGIAGSSLTGDEVIEDCHVDADLVANNTVGGIIGTNKRSTINRCYVEGTIEATTANRWTDEGPCAGGIVGRLAASASTSEGAAKAPATEGVVTNNMVRLTSLKGYTPKGSPKYAQQFTTLHRIVGWTRVNYEPDANVNTEPDDGIANNYVIDSIGKVAADVADDDKTTEGKSIAESDLNKEFFENTLGMEFGDDKAWNELTETDPALNHETATFFNPSVITPEENSTFEATLVIVSRTQLNPEDVVADFSCDSSDEEVASPTGNFRMEGNNLVIEFQCSKVGTAVITAYVNGGQARCTVNSKTSGVESITATDGAAISYDGTSVKAQDCSLALYSISGSTVASGRDIISVSGLLKGIYIAVATDASGERKVLKIIVK